MQLGRRAALLGLASLAACNRRGLGASHFPNRSVRMIVPFPPGGPSDLVGRTVASVLSEHWGENVVVENRNGASGSIGSLGVLRAPPDGYTLVLGNNASHGAYEILYPRLAPYHALRDFAPVALVGFSQTIMTVNPSLPVHTLQEFVDYVRERPGQVHFGTAAFGGAPHLCGELLNLRADIDMRVVNYNGAAPAMLALLANQVQVYMGGVSTVVSMVRDGKVRAIAVMSEERAPEMPDLPTAGESGFPDVSWDSWYGLLTSARVRASILDQENAAVNETMAGDAMLARLQGYGIKRRLGTREDFAKTIRDEFVRTRDIVRAANLDAD